MDPYPALSVANDTRTTWSFHSSILTSYTGPAITLLPGQARLSHRQSSQTLEITLVYQQGQQLRPDPRTVQIEEAKTFYNAALKLIDLVEKASRPNPRTMCSYRVFGGLNKIHRLCYKHVNNMARFALIPPTALHKRSAPSDWKPRLSHAAAELDSSAVPPTPDAFF